MNKELKIELEQVSAVEDELMRLSIEERLPADVQELIGEGCLALMKGRNLLQLIVERDSIEAAATVI